MPASSVWRGELLPVEVAGDSIQYQINRTTRGWVIELINNAGVAKQPDQPATTDPNAIAGWRSGRESAAFRRRNGGRIALTQTRKRCGWNWAQARVCSSN